MAITTDLYLELIGDDGKSPSSASFNWTQQRVRRKGIITNTNAASGGTISPVDLVNFIPTLAGDTAFGVNQSAPGMLQRTPPLNDAQYVWLYVDDIPTIQGVGAPITKSPVSDGFQVGSIPNFALFNNYEIELEFRARPYPVLFDSNIAPLQYSISWTDSTGASQNNLVYPEWLRYCDWDFIPPNPGEGYISQPRASMKIVTGTGATPNNLMYQGQPRMYLPDQIFRILWIMVPTRYITSTNSYLQKFRGRINQNNWNGPGYAIYQGGSAVFGPGSLLYLGYKFTKYSRIVPGLDTVLGVINYDKLCNIELYFLHTVRNSTDAANTPSNHNFVVGGHNLQPYFPKRSFFYSIDTANNSTPNFLSFPIELLFQDPDAQGNYTGNG